MAARCRSTRVFSKSRLHVRGKNLPISGQLDQRRGSPILAGCVVCRNAAICPKLRDKPTSRAHRRSGVVDPERTCAPSRIRIYTRQSYFPDREIFPAAPFILRGWSLRKLAPRCGCCQHYAILPERFDAELVSVDLAWRRRRAGEAGRKGTARYRGLPAVSDRASAVMKTRYVEVRHCELQPCRSWRHIGEPETRRAGAPREGRGKGKSAGRGQQKRKAGEAERRGILVVPDRSWMVP